MTMTSSERTTTGICSSCHKVWVQDQAQGVCQWCGQLANRLNTLTSPRLIKSGRTRRKPSTVEALGYNGLTGRWQSYYETATRYEGKIPTQDRDDYRHDTMLELERAERRDGKLLPLPRAYRIAALMVALYFRNRNYHLERICIWNGYPVAPHCQQCDHKPDKPRCDWLAVRPVARLDAEVMDEEGYRVRLLDTVASERDSDMPDYWYDVKSLANALPLRLAEIAYKRLEGHMLTNSDRQYLWRFHKSQQKSLF